MYVLIYWYNLSYNSWKKITMYTCIWQCRIHPIPANILLILFLDMTSNCSTHFSFRSLMAISCQWKRDTPQHTETFIKSYPSLLVLLYLQLQNSRHTHITNTNFFPSQIKNLILSLVYAWRLFHLAINWKNICYLWNS